MAQVTLTRHLRRFFPSLEAGEVPGATVREVIDALERRHPGFASYVMPVGSRVAVGHGGGGTGSGMDNGFKQFTDGSYQVVVLANWEAPAGGRLADAIIRYLGADVQRGGR